MGGDSSFVARIAQSSFDQLKTSKDQISRTAHSLVLGCLHRYVGGMGSGQHLQMSVTILHKLTQDTSTVVQVRGMAIGRGHTVSYASGWKVGKGSFLVKGGHLILAS